MSKIIIDEEYTNVCLTAGAHIDEEYTNVEYFYQWMFEQLTKRKF